MNIQLTKKQFLSKQKIRITGSKSETNRLLLLQALFPTISIENESNSDDTQMMRKGLKISDGKVDIHHAGTAMRFLTAFFAVSKGKNVILTGSERMKQRPIGILVDALRTLGADIEYLEKEGCPPLKIVGKKIEKREVSVQANMSSQYISALMLVGACLSNGLKINLIGECTSLPYLQMTLSLLQEVGIKSFFSGNSIEVHFNASVERRHIVVESDWSSASYFYSLVALSEIGCEVTLSAYKENSLQGDSILVQLYMIFGVETIFSDHQILLRKVGGQLPDKFEYDFTNAPDIAQTLAVTCFGLGIACHLRGLHTLKIKETDRLEALREELTKLGANVKTTDAEIFILPAPIKENVSINTYNDHRMAMAFAPLALCVPISINNGEVVSKSYPDFWQDFSKITANQGVER